MNVLAVIPARYGSTRLPGKPLAPIASKPMIQHVCERDPEGSAANDYAMFRYDMNRLGRFSSPDPLSGSIADPQSLNRCAYARNDSINLIDPSGLTWFCVTVFGPGGPSTECQWEPGAGGSLTADTFDFFRFLWPFSTSTSFMHVGEEHPTRFEQNQERRREEREDAQRHDSQSWWQEFGNSLLENLATDCFTLFLTESSKNFITPGASSLGPVAGTAYSTITFNQALRYAATTPNTINGAAGLLYPQNSSVFRGLMAEAQSGAAVGALIQLNISMGQALFTEYQAASSGKCH